MECFVQHAVDYKGMAADRTETGGLLSAALIAVIEICERFSTIGICVNLVPYLMRTMHLSSPTSANIVSNFMGTSFILCPAGGILADSYLGRYRTILIFALIQGLGTSLLAISAALPQLWPPPCDPDDSSTCVQPTSPQMAALYVSLYLMAIGTSGLSPNVSSFCTDQFDEKNEDEISDLRVFCNFFFFFLTIWTVLAVTLVVYIQDELSRSWGYGVCSLSMMVAILMFLSGTRTYRYKKLTKTPLLPVLQVLVAAVKKRRYQVPANVEQLYEDNPDSSRIHHTDQFKFLDKAAIPTKDAFLSSNAVVPDPWKVSSVTRVEEVKMILKVLPIWATTIIFWTAFSQLMTFSVEQASTMNRSIGIFTVPPASITIFFILPIIFSLGLYHLLIRPIWTKLTGKHGFTNLQKIGLGLILAALGMAAAAVSEVKRLSAVRSEGPRSSSVLLLIPQFVLVGSGVGFMYTGQLDLFIIHSRKGMKIISAGIFLSTIALGFFFSSILVSIVNKLSAIRGGKSWIGHTINTGRLDRFYALLAILISTDFCLFLLCAVWFKPHNPGGELQMDGGDSVGKDVKASAVV